VADGEQAPDDPGPLAEATVHGGEAVGRGRGAGATENGSLAGMKVLLVEDNLINQKVGKRMLTALDCHVTVPSLHSDL
jgi:hypothetical protein